MAEGIRIWQEVIDLEQALEDASDMLDRYDVALPAAEEAYQLALHDAFLELRRSEGVTVAREVVRGVPEVAKLRRERDELRCRSKSLRAFKEDLRAKLYVRNNMARNELTRPSNS